MPPTYRVVCAHCNSDQVYLAAYGKWSVSEQVWSFHTDRDSEGIMEGYCDDCDGTTKLLMQEVV